MSTDGKPPTDLVPRRTDPSTLPEKYEKVSEEKILEKSRVEILAQMENGDKVRVPFRLWQVAIQKCYITHDVYLTLVNSERDIYERHMKAVQRRQLSYKDPKTKSNVLTVTALLLQGKCCGNACRHCPYGHENVPEDRKHLKVFNGSYYI